VRSQTMRTRISDGAPRTMEEMHRFGGTVRDGDGQPVADAWVTLPELGMWSATDRDGRFLFRRIAPGTMHLTVRTLDGGEADATVQVPGQPADVVVGGKKRAAAKGTSGPKS
jgi:protocatechuate 3,4-dioxygenase beta subunit